MLLAVAARGHVISTRRKVGIVLTLPVLLVTLTALAVRLSAG
ncbi:hypothetical protein ACW7G3_04505 [Luteimonas sp. A478]